MWRLVMMMMMVNLANAQKKWDGGGGNNLWNNALNWSPDGVPDMLDDVVLDNTTVRESYLVELPGGVATTQVKSILILPAATTITLVLPAANTAVPGLSLTNTSESLIVHDGGSFVNASGAGSGSSFQLAGKIRLNNGGRYVHRTARGNAELIDKLVNEPGTEKGIFEFDVPGTAGYTVSLTGNTFGSLMFRAATAGGAKSYSGSGTSDLTIRGDLVIEPGVVLTSTLTSDVNLGGSLIINGRLNLHPVTTGTTGRSFVFGGKDVVFQGIGTLSMNAFFRNLLVARSASLTLEAPCLLSLTPNTFICQGSLDCKAGYVGGPGSFFLSDDATLYIRSPDGISQNSDKGDIRSAFRNFSPNAAYHYVGSSSQVSGDGLPASIPLLAINNPYDLVLSKPLTVTGNLALIYGKIISSDMNLLSLASPSISSRTNLWGDLDAGWENSYVSGPVKWIAGDGTWRTVPVGNGNGFTPLQLKNAGATPATILIEYKLGPHINNTLLPSLNSVSNSGHYQVSLSDGQWQTALSFVPADTPRTEAELLRIAALQEVNGDWKWGDAGGSIVAGTQSGYGWLRSDSVLSSFTGLALGYQANALLPITLLKFTARNAGARNELYWEADQDGKDARFMVERSTDGLHFSTIRETYSPIRSSITTHQFIDEDPPSPYGYYRLVMLAANQKTTSAVVRVSCKKQKANLYPNPARDWVNINFPNQSSVTELELVNRYGVVLRTLFVKNKLFQIGVSDLSPGFYIVRLRSSTGETTTLPFTKY